MCVCSLCYNECSAYARWHIAICGLSGSTLFYHINSKKLAWFLFGGWGGGALHIKCAFCCSVQIFSETFLILRRIKRNIIINVHRSSCKVPLLSSKFMNLKLSRQIFTKKQMSKFMKIRPVVAELFHAGGRTDGRTRKSQKSLFAILRTRLKGPQI